MSKKANIAAEVAKETPELLRWFENSKQKRLDKNEQTIDARTKSQEKLTKAASKLKEKHPDASDIYYGADGSVRIEFEKRSSEKVAIGKVIPFRSKDDIA